MTSWSTEPSSTRISQKRTSASASGSTFGDFICSSAGVTSRHVSSPAKAVCTSNKRKRKSTRGCFLKNRFITLLPLNFIFFTLFNGLTFQKLHLGDTQQKLKGEYGKNSTRFLSFQQG